MERHSCEIELLTELLRRYFNIVGTNNQGLHALETVLLPMLFSLKISTTEGDTSNLIDIIGNFVEQNDVFGTGVDNDEILKIKIRRKVLVAFIVGIFMGMNLKGSKIP